MYRSIRAASIFSLLAIAVSAAVRPVQAAGIVNLASGAPEITESGSWQTNSGTANDTSPFGGQNITNGGPSTPASLGLFHPGYTPVQENSSGDGTFWLPAQGSTPTIDGVANQGYVTIDLGAAHSIGEIDLYNTSNGHINDRGTETFRIDGSNSVNGSGNLINPHEVLSGTLTPTVYYGVGSNLATPDIFNPAGGSLGDYRYLTFIAITGLNNQPGLNEIRLFAAPEPGSVVLMGLGVIGLTILRRRKK